MVIRWSERVGIDAVDHCGKRGGFAGTGSASDQDKTALLFADAIDDRGQVEFVRGANLGGDDAKDHADVAALLEDVNAEAAEAGNAVSHVELGGLFKFLFLAVGHHAERHGEHLFWRDAGDVGERRQQAIDAEIWVIADFEVQVGRLVFDGASKKIVNVQWHEM